MALFKILKGKSSNLPNIKATEGYAYFTPDDGKFYIDIATSDNVLVGSSSIDGANRICINSGNDFGDILILDCGTAIIAGNITPTVLYFNCGDSTSVVTSETIMLECGNSITEVTSNTIFYDCGDSALKA